MTDGARRYRTLLCGTQDEEWIEMEEAPDGEWVMWEEYDHLRDYAKCYVENNEALQKENAELRDKVKTLEVLLYESEEEVLRLLRGE